MTPRYRCLILDHDDTAVDSTAEIHYPAHVEIMRQIRPGVEPISLDGWYRKNFDPGLMEYLVEELRFTREELIIEYDIWRSFTTDRVPRFYPGFLDFSREFRASGGIVTVVSHSEKEIIEKRYETVSHRRELVPDMIFGWTDERERRKPSPYPVLQILDRFDLTPEEALIVDDLKPGVLMGNATGVPVAAAGWGHQIPEIQEYMEKNCRVYLSSIDELRDYVFRSG